MKKILLSMVMLAGAVGAIALSTSAYFSDTEESVANSFTTGTIDIAVDGDNPWSRQTPYQLLDMKPGYTDYVDFVVENVGSNPANIWKDINVTGHQNDPVSEPECEAEDGSWTDEGGHGTCSGNEAITDLETQILYDLSVQVFNGDHDMMWEQVLYDVDATLAEAYAAAGPNGIFLGMVPAGWTMEVHQSYHMIPESGNAYQGDGITFDIDLYAEQLKGSVVLEDKDPSNWQVDLSSPEMGTLTYILRHPTFDYSFTGVVPLPNTEYVLAAGYDGGTNVDTEIGRGTSDGSGNISFSGDVELGKDMLNVKVWLIPASAWGGSSVTNWGQMPNFLWETGLIEYLDTNN